ncbi:MAG: Flp pilus assembly protein CpaB [Bacillota bacterium]|nr:Flp pilus assembly protein CpaB [Bacillota bacterium]
MESTNKKIVAAAVILALITAFLIYVYIKNSEGKPVTVQYTNVYVAVNTLPAKHKIEDSDIKLAKIAREYVNPDAIFDKNEIIGKNLKESIIAGEQILHGRLIDDRKTELAYNVPKDKRAVSFNINEQIAVSDLIRPGDFVDVLASFDKEEVDSNGNKITYPRTTKIIIQNVQVLAMSQDQLITDEKLKEPPKTVTLAVSPEDSVKLTYATEYGVVRLALRSVGDDNKVDSPEIIRNDLVSGKGAATSSNGQMPGK